MFERKECSMDINVNHCTIKITSSLQIAKRKEPLPADQLDEHEDNEFIRRKNNCTIFLGYTSNMASCGVRETIRFLAQHKMVSLLFRVSIVTCGMTLEGVSAA